MNKPIRVLCPHCGKRVKAQPRHLGRRVRCPNCKEPFRAQAAENAGELPQVEQPQQAPAQAAGQTDPQVPPAPLPQEAQPPAPPPQPVAAGQELVPAQPARPPADVVPPPPPPPPAGPPRQGLPPVAVAEAQSVVSSQGPTMVIVERARGQSGLGIASFVIGLIALFFFCFPVVGVLVGGLGLLFGLLAFLSRSRKGLAIAGLALNGIAFTVSLVFWMGVFAAVSEGVKEIDRAVQESSRRASASANGDTGPGDGKTGAGQEESWTPYDQPVRLGQAEVRIERVELGQVETDSGGVSRNKLLVVWLRITNLDDKKRLRFGSWLDSTGLTFGKERPTIEDDVGNTYRAVSTALWKPKGHQGHEHIYPGKSILTAVLFEPPVDAAKVLRLKLPAEEIGEAGDNKGWIRFEVPRNFVRR